MPPRMRVRLPQNRCILVIFAVGIVSLVQFFISEYTCQFLNDKDDNRESMADPTLPYNPNLLENQNLNTNLNTNTNENLNENLNDNQNQYFNANPNYDALYFANELALHTERIDDPYDQQYDLREENFESEIQIFESIGRDLLLGNLESFSHLSRYYVHPSKYKEYKREWILHKWTKEKIQHIGKNELLMGHPSCPIINSLNDIKKNNINTIEIHFTHNCCKKTQPPHEKSAFELGKWNNVIHYTMHNLTYDFYQKNKHILTQKRGAGYWVWKPYVILDALINHANPCDIVCYCDTGAWWNNTAFPLWEYTSKVKYGVMAFNHLLSDWKYVNLTERWYSKRDAFLLLGVDYYDMYDTVIRKATFSCYQKNPDSIHFVSEWLYHSQDERIITDIDNTFGLNNIPHFSGNRHDQSIFSLISKKYGIPAFSDVSQYGYNDVRVYGDIVTHWDKPWIIKHTRGKQ